MPVSNPDDEYMEGLWQRIKAEVGQMAPMLAPDTDARKLNGDDVSMLFNKRHMSLEEEWNLWRAKNPDGTPMFTREMIGLMVFKDREGLAKRGGRLEPKDQIQWVNQQAKREAARRQAQAPPPDPMTSMMSATPAEMPGSFDEGADYG
jgi:hypothetical protein